MRTWMQVARLATTKTLQGGLVATVAPGLPFLLSAGMEVAFVPPQHDAPRRSRVLSVRDEGKGRHLVTFEGVDDVETASRLAGLSVLARRADLPQEVVLAEEEGLVGWEVHDVACGFVGTVGEVVESPGQILLSLDRPDGDEPALVPLVDAFLVGFDEDARRIDVSLPAGLLDL